MAFNDRLTTYAGDEVLFVFGPVIASGYGPDTFVTVERNEDAFTLQVGADGESTRSKSNNRSATITLTLLQGSAANAQLSAIHALDQATPAGDGVLPLLVKDNSGNSLHLAEKAWIRKAPASAYGRESDVREWVFETANLVDAPAGN